KTKTYDGSAFTAFTATISGFVNGETMSVVSGSPTFSGSAVGALNAGSYVITPTLGTLSATNYDFTPFTNGALTIGQATSHVVITWTNTTYSGTPNAAAAVVQDAANAPISGATATLVYYSGSVASGPPLSGAPTNVGTYTVRASYDGS